jgi:hypothetical protein
MSLALEFRAFVRGASMPKSRKPVAAQVDGSPKNAVVVFEGPIPEGFYIDGSVELLEGLVDDEELAELRAYALEAAQRRVLK